MSVRREARSVRRGAKCAGLALRIACRACKYEGAASVVSTHISHWTGWREVKYRGHAGRILRCPVCKSLNVKAVVGGRGVHTARCGRSRRLEERQPLWQPDAASAEEKYERS